MKADNKNISYKNRGMLLEKIINTSINHYINSNVAYFKKNNLEIKFQSIASSTDSKKIKLNNSFINGKSTVDYYGLYKSRYITFEAKSTDDDNLPISNIKPHQHKHLLFIKSLGGISFYLIFFKHQSKIFLVDVEDIDYENMKYLSYEYISSIGKELDIIFPGIIDFLSVLNIS